MRTASFKFDMYLGDLMQSFDQGSSHRLRRRLPISSAAAAATTASAPTRSIVYPGMRGSPMLQHRVPSVPSARCPAAAAGAVTAAGWRTLWHLSQAYPGDRRRIRQRI